MNDWRLAIVASAFFAVQAVHAAEIRVPADFSTIQQAVDAASAGDVIVIAPGSYAISAPVTVSVLPLTLRAEDPQNRPTLDGSGSSTLLVIRDTGSPGVTVDGLVFINGRATEDFHGGCAVVRDAIATIRNSEFRNCQTDPGDAGTSGGGLKVSVGGRAVIEDSVFIGNRSYSQGGGVHFLRSSGEVRRSTFSGNIAKGDPVSGGGGVKSTFSDGVVTVRDSIFLDNEASFAGGAISGFGSDMDIINNEMRRNGNGRFGGAIHLETLVGSGGDRQFLIQGNIIEDNFIVDIPIPGIEPAFDRVSGGGVHLNFGVGSQITASKSIIENNSIRNNRATDSRCAGTNGENAAICANGGGIVFFNARPQVQIVRNNNISGNIADAYGAALFDKVELMFAGNTVAGNQARKTMPALGCVNNNLSFTAFCEFSGNRISNNGYLDRAFGEGSLNDSGAINVRLNQAWIYNNVFHANAGSLATIFIRHEDGPGFFSRVDHNTFVDNLHDPDAFQFGIVMIRGAGAIRNNIMVGSNRAIRADDFLANADSRIDGNNIIGGSLNHVARIQAIIYSTVDNLNELNQASGNLALSPGFMGGHSGDFRLDEGSALINRATCLSGISVDIDGIQRPQGNACDPGAHEWFFDDTLFADRFED